MERRDLLEVQRILASIATALQDDFAKYGTRAQQRNMRHVLRYVPRNIVHGYGIGQSEGIDYIAMEYVSGYTLDEFIPRKGMRLSLALKHAVQVADAPWPRADGSQPVLSLLNVRDLALRWGVAVPAATCD